MTNSNMTNSNLRPVILRSDMSGVWAGYASDITQAADGSHVVRLQRGRRLWSYYGPQDVSGVAAGVPLAANSDVSAETDVMVSGCCEVHYARPGAVEAIMSAPIFGGEGVVQ